MALRNTDYVTSFNFELSAFNVSHQEMGLTH